jgi:hypothetical protein
VPPGAEQPDQEVLVGESGEAAGVQLHRVGAGEVRPLRQGRHAGDGAPGAQALALLGQDLPDGVHHQQLVHNGARVIHVQTRVADFSRFIASVSVTTPTHSAAVVVWLS